jgi:hypothetical protein
MSGNDGIGLLETPACCGLFYGKERSCLIRFIGNILFQFQI